MTQKQEGQKAMSSKPLEVIELKRLADRPKEAMLQTSSCKTLEEARAWGLMHKARRVFTFWHRLGYMDAWCEK